MPKPKPPKEFELINPRKEPLTPERLKMFPGCENISEAEAEEIVFALQALAYLLVDCKVWQEHEMFQ
jgi:hypothetical protein